MSKYLNYIYIIVFVVAGVFFFSFVSSNFGSLREIFNYQKSKNVNRQENLTSYASNITGQLFSKKSSFGTGTFSCVNNKNEALELITSEVEAEFESKAYYNSEVKPKLANASIENDEFFYKVTLPSDIKDTKFNIPQNIFNCEFFNPEFKEYIPAEITMENEVLGTLTSKRSETELNKLVDILYHFKIVSLGDLGKKIEITDTSLGETETTVTRKDKGVYSESNGLLSSTKYIAELIFTLDKNTGEISFTKKIE